MADARPDEPPVARGGWMRRLRRTAGAAVALALPALALHASGPLAAAGAWLGGLVLLALAAWPSGRPRTSDADTAAETAAAADAEAIGSDIDASADSQRECTRLVRNLVPVWQRNVEAARSHSERAASDLLQSFATLSTEMDQALAAAGSGMQIELGAADELTGRHRDAVERLLADSREAHRRLRTMREGLGALAEPLRTMRDSADEVRAIGRSAHMLALNTAAEAHRSGAAGSGVRVAATELRDLAAQARDASRALLAKLADVDARIASIAGRPDADAVAADDDELALRAEASARALAVGMLGSLDEAGRASRTLQRTGRQLHTELEKILIGLQSQDRLSQMLGSVTDDMQRLHAWLRGAEDPAALAPSQWLARLESSYTMEEMRSSHHGTASVDAGSTVEFF